MIVFNSTLSESAKNGKEFDIGCGTVKLLYTDSVKLHEQVAQRCMLETGYASVYEFDSEVKFEGKSKKETYPLRVKLSESHERIKDEEFVKLCIIDAKCKDTEGNDIDTELIRKELLKQENKVQLREIYQVASQPLYFLKKLEQEAKEDLGK